MMLFAFVKEEDFLLYHDLFTKGIQMFAGTWFSFWPKNCTVSDIRNTEKGSFACLNKDLLKFLLSQKLFWKILVNQDVPDVIK